MQWQEFIQAKNPYYLAESIPNEDHCDLSKSLQMMITRACRYNMAPLYRAFSQVISFWNFVVLVQRYVQTISELRQAFTIS
jgi:hypothetical protein